MSSSGSGAVTPPISILGVPFDFVTPEQTVERIIAMVASGRPHYLATANVDFVVQALEDAELRRILFDAHLVLADGMPVVWASRLLSKGLPGRVTGSDLVPRLLAEAEKRNWRVFFLGSTEQSLAKAVQCMRSSYPALTIAGAYSPPFRPLLEMDHRDILGRLRASRPDLLFVAFGCPKQEKWLNMHYRQAGVPVGIGVGATIDFLAGTFRRAPRWMQRTGLEWVFRLLQEPRRLAGRYGRGLWIFGRAILRQWWQMRSRRGPVSAVGSASVASARGSVPVLTVPERLDAANAAELQEAWEAAVARGPVILDLSGTDFVDSTGIGALIRVQQRARALRHHLILAAAPARVRRVISLMRLEEMFELAPSLAEARRRLSAALEMPSVLLASLTPPVVCWQGEVTVQTADGIAQKTRAAILESGPDTTVTIDLHGVRFLDSSGLGAMVSLKRDLGAEGYTVRFTNAGPTVQNVLHITRLDEYLLGSKL